MGDKLLRILAADSTMNKAVTKVILEILVENGLTSFEELGQRITKECKEGRNLIKSQKTLPWKV